MPDHLIIEHISLVAVDRERLTPKMRRYEIRPYTLTVSVRNTSGESLYVISSIRQIRYDEARRALVLHFAEQDFPSGGVSGRIPFPPQFTVIRSGQRGSFTCQLSSPMSFSKDTVEGETEVSHVRIPEDVEVIECTIGHGSTPPNRSINPASREVRTRWVDWGDTITASWHPPKTAG